jgi:hypothetical protein
MAFGFDPTRARQLLTQAGWTPLPSGGLIASMLGQFGIRVTPRAIPASALYARGRSAPLYGRQFDMALFDWSAGIEPPAELFLSEEVSGDCRRSMPPVDKLSGVVPRYSSGATCQLFRSSVRCESLLCDATSPGSHLTRVRRARCGMRSSLRSADT